MLTEEPSDGFKEVVPWWWWVSHGQADVIVGGIVALVWVGIVRRRQETVLIETKGISPGFVRAIEQSAIDVRGDLV